MRITRKRHAQADGAHGLFEEVAVLGLLNGLDLRADEFDPEAIEHTGAAQLDGEVERGLAAQGGQKRIGPLTFDDLGHEIHGEWLDVGAVGHLRVGHDGGRVGVDQHHPEALLAQGLDPLRA